MGKVMQKSICSESNFFYSSLRLISIHPSSLRVAAQLSIRRWADRSAAPGTSTAAAMTLRAALLQRQQLLRPERLVVDLTRRLDQVLQVRPRQEVSQVHKLAVVLVLDVDHTPAVLPAAHLLAVDDNVLFATDDGERDDVLLPLGSILRVGLVKPYLDLRIHCPFLIIQLVIVVRVHLEVVERKLLLNALLECLALLQCQGVGLGNHRHNVDNIGQLLKNNNVNRFQPALG